MQYKSSIIFVMLLVIGCAWIGTDPAAAAEARKPDLVITGITAPQSGVPGAKISLLVTIQNAGGAVSSYSYTNLYLSKDSFVDPSDSCLGRVFTSSLSPGSARSVSYSATIPSGSAGSFYILGEADGSGRILEENEMNNAGRSGVLDVSMGGPTIAPTLLPTSLPSPGPTFSPPRSPKPDLTISGITAPSKMNPGEKAALSATVRNDGNITASFSYVYFYLSTDTVLDTGDTYLGRNYISSISPGYARTVSTSLLIPPHTSGNVHLCALADGSGKVAEEDEGNNVRCSAGITVEIGQTQNPTPSLTPTPTPAIILKPDLRPLVIDGPENGTTGSSLTVQVTVRNSGLKSSGRTGAAMYLSQDGVISPGDTYIGSLPVPSVSPGDTLTVSGNVAVPATVPPGTYYLGTILDPANTISETDEDNNIVCDTGPVQIRQGVQGGFSAEAQVEAAILKYTNQERTASGINPLVPNSLLTSVARAHSLDMKERNFFSHTNPDWLSPFDRIAAAGYPFSAAAENIAAISLFTLSSSPDETGRYFVQEMWMKSDGHRENILSSSYTEVGIGVVYESDRISSPYGFIATQEFGRPS